MSEAGFSSAEKANFWALLLWPGAESVRVGVNYLVRAMPAPLSPTADLLLHLRGRLEEESGILSFGF